MKGKIKVLFLVVKHVLRCDWTNEESLEAAFRNSRQNRQNESARIQSFIVPSECGHLGFWTEIFQIFVHIYADFFPPVKLMNNMWGISMGSELRSE